MVPSPLVVQLAPTDLWESTGQEVASALRAMGLPIGPVVTMETRGKGGAREALNEIREADKVKGQSQNMILKLLLVNKYISSEVYV